MMLPADMAFLKDPEFKKWVEIYAADEPRFFRDFAKAYKKLIELGLPPSEGCEEYTFQIYDGASIDAVTNETQPEVTGKVEIKVDNESKQ